MATSNEVETSITNYARLGHAAQELLPDILKELVSVKQSYSTLRSVCLGLRCLKPMEWHIINNAASDGFENFDVNLLYKLCRNLELVPAPTQGWSHPCDPMAHELTIGDDVERIRRMRNTILHRGNTNVTEIELRQMFQEFKEMARRVETYLAKPSGELVNKFKELEKRSMDPKAEEQFTQTIEILARRETDISEDIKQMKQNQESHNGLFQDYESEWMEEQKNFVITGATRRALDLLTLDNCVVVSGCPGSGKSAIIQHIALRLKREQGYEIIPIVMEPNDLLQYSSPDHKQVYILDNTFGTITVNRHVVDKWCSYLDPIRKLLNRGNMKMLLACRSQIVRDPDLKTLKELVSNRCSLEEHRLSHEERADIAEKYLGKANVDTISDVLDAYDFLPLLCKLYICKYGKDHEDIRHFFQYPDEAIRENLNEIKEHTDKTHYCALAVCVLYNNSLHETWFEKDSKYAEFIQPICEELCLDFKVTRVLLRQRLDELVNTFVKKLGGQYSIIHDRLYDVTASVCGQNFVNCFIQYASSTFIGDRFHFISVDGKPDDLAIKLSIEHEVKYFNRLLADLLSEDTYSTFQNKQLRYAVFREKLLRFFKNNQRTICNIIRKFDSAQKTKNEGKKIEESFYLSDSEESETEPDHEFEKYIAKVNFDRSDEEMQVNFDHRDKEMQILSNIPVVIPLPLLDAASQGYDDIVTCLIRFGSDVNIADDMGRTALYLAAFNGHESTVKILIDYGGRSSIADKWDRLPLYVACEEGHTGVLNVLLQTSDTSRCDSCFFKTPLFVACERGHRAVVEILLRHGCNVNQKNSDGQSALHIVCDNGYYNIAKSLIEFGAEVNLKGEKNETPLFIACQNGYIEIVDLLMSSDGDVSLCNSYGLTPLHVASRHGHLSVVKTLIRKNLTLIDSSDHLYERTPLILAIEGKHEEIAILLVQEHCNIYHCDKRGQSALYLACKFGLASLVNNLLEQMTDYYILSFNYKDWSPMVASCEGGYSSIVRMLVERNVAVNSCCDGKYPLHIACEHGFTGVVEMLLEANCDVNCSEENGPTALYIACENGFVEIVRLLLDKKAELQYVDEYGWSAFHIACICGYTDIVELFIHNDIHTTRLDNKQRSPLNLACKAGHDSVVEVLLQNGAYVNETDIRKWSPLHTASKEGHLNIVQILLNYGADTALRNMGNKLAIDLARSSFKKDVVTLLESNTDPDEQDKASHHLMEQLTDSD